MPVANEEATMGKIIEDILLLPYDNLYLYPVVDNYSKDKTEEIILSYEKTGRVKCIFYQESKGVISCYLEGFRQALKDGAEQIIEMDGGGSHSLKGMFIDHPIEANIWEMDIDNQIDYLKSIAAAGCNRNVEKPERFVDWIYWKLGTRIAEDYMLPYNRKIFSSNLNELGTYWMDKLPNVSFENTLRSCLEHRAFGEEPGHAQFYYPKKYGYGEVWNRMAEELGPNIQYGFRVRGIDFEEKIVWDHNGTKIRGENIITTIPWQEFRELKNIPLEIKNSLLMLKQSSIQVEYVPRQLETDAHWIYYPEEELAYHRILVRHNFCPGSKGYWTETNCERLHEVVIKDSFYNQYAYPLNTIEKPQIMKRLISWAEKMQIFPLGRWGEHQHYNSDVTVVKAIELFEKIGI